jgi:hypothetical protein
VEGLKLNGLSQAFFMVVLICYGRNVVYRPTAKLSGSDYS